MAPPIKLHVAIGQRFGRGTVIDLNIRMLRTGRPGTDRGARLRCDCGTEYEAQVSHLLKGNIKSCGCQRSDAASKRMRQLRGTDPGGYRLPPTQRMTSHPLYQIWRGILDRCENSRNNRYRRYGGRGIRVCDAGTT